MKKWLMVLDQVGVSQFQHTLPNASQKAWPAPRNLALSYLPRTTPVGHATISTGCWPANHQVQGRQWLSSGGTLSNVALLPNLHPVTGTVFQQIHSNSLASKLRADAAHNTAAIIAVATKDFIPFLFGAWDTDVSVYPRTTRPDSIANGFAIDVVFDAFTAQGDSAVQQAMGNISSLAAGLIGSGWTTSWLPAVSGPTGGAHVRHTMRWQVPAAWGTSGAVVGRSWRSFIDAHIIDVDQFYTDVAQELLVHVDPNAPQIVLQSAVATDTYGHFHGPSSTQYSTALTAGIRRAELLHNGGWSVLVTSDHGGRDTPIWWTYASGPPPTVTSTTAVTLHAGAVILEGDHVVGYGLANPGAAGPTIEKLDWQGAPASLIAVTALPQNLLANSFHPAQRPSWIVLPDDNATIMDVPRSPGKTLGGGGSHGACADLLGNFSQIDGAVPLAWLGTLQPPSTATELRQVAGEFLRLR